MTHRNHYDHVVVGAGAAGCVLAGRLSEDPRTRVLLVESGPSDRVLPVRVPAGFAQLIGSRRDWDLRTTPQPGLDGRSLRWPRGRMLGGSTSMNAQVYARGHRADYDAWAEQGAEGWSWDDVAPWFAALEGSTGSHPSLGTDGPQLIDDLVEPNPLTLAFLDAADQVGIRPGDPNAPDALGASISPVTQRRGRRWSAADAYLHPARRRPNLHVVTGATVRRVLLDQGRATGVEVVDRAGRVTRVRARREVVLAAGSIGSPQVLLASGIGPADHLREAGVPVLVDLPDVGSHLADHLMAITVVTTEQPVSLATASRPRHLAEYLLRRRGPLTSNVAEALALVSTAPDAAPDVELVFAPVPYLDHGTTPPPGHGFSVGAVLLQPRSTGTVRLDPASPAGAPVIDPGYLGDADGDDLRRLTAAVELSRQVMAAPAFAPYAARPLRGPIDDDVEGFVRSQAETIYHPVGTCRMGRAGESVVDPELRVRGVAGLRVADASVMPRIVRGHTAAPTMMIAERVASLLSAPHGARRTTGATR